MKLVSTTEAKAKLNALLVEVAAGETVTITSHGRPVAVLSKAEPPVRVMFERRVRRAGRGDAAALGLEPCRVRARVRRCRLSVLLAAPR